MVRILSQTKYDHVAMVIRLEDGKIMLLEALRESGVGLCEWSRFLNKKWNKLYN